jgi:hypothetical protein
MSKVYPCGCVIKFHHDYNDWGYSGDDKDTEEPCVNHKKILDDARKLVEKDREKLMKEENINQRIKRMRVDDDIQREIKRVKGVEIQRGLKRKREDDEFVNFVCIKAN